MAGSVGQALVKLPPARNVTLRGGTPILVRPVGPKDKDRLRAGFARLSRLSRYQRFLTSQDTLSEQQLRYFAEIDHVNHMAWGALDPTMPPPTHNRDPLGAYWEYRRNIAARVL